MNSIHHTEPVIQAEIRLSHFFAEQIKYSTTYFGYPEVPTNNDLSILGVSSLAKLHLNNAGDPWVHGNAKMHTKAFEREALDFVARLYDIEDDYWGYITSGGTEGNLYGMYMGRDFFAKQNRRPVALFSSHSHYSIPKNAHLLGVEAITVEAQPSGELDYLDLKRQMQRLRAEDPAIGFFLNLNIGTTMTGAIDQIDAVNAVLAELGIGLDDILIHADAALLGFIYPFFGEGARLFQQGVSSIAISGHKFPGAIHPCGVILTKRDIQRRAFGEQWVSYVGSRDTTISGSRNGFLALNLWYIFQKKGVEGFRREGQMCIDHAHYLAESLRQMDYPAVGHIPQQIIVTFQKPSPAIVAEYQLATQGDLAHVVVMQHITRDRIDAFCEALRR